MSKIIDYDLEARKMSCDGVTVAKQIKLSDPIEELGVKMMHDANIRTSESAGDVTTTTTLLAQKLIDAGMKKVEAGINPMDLKRGIDIVKNPEKKTTSILTPDEVL